MNRIDAMVSWFLRQLGAVLLLISILLVPQNRALGSYGGTVCQGEPCEIATCTAYWTLNLSCPNKCSDDTSTYCKCTTEANDCADCTCQRNGVQEACSCLLKSS